MKRAREDNKVYNEGNWMMRPWRFDFENETSTNMVIKVLVGVENGNLQGN